MKTIYLYSEQTYLAMVKSFFYLFFLVIFALFFSPSKMVAQETLSAFGTTLYSMEVDEINQEIIGRFFVHRPPTQDFRYDPDDGTLGIITNINGFTLVNAFAQTIYPAKGSGNINGQVTDKANYFDGRWYKGKRNGETIYVLVGHKLSIDVICFANRNWIGNKSIPVETSPGAAAILKKGENDVWYYLNRDGAYPFKKK